MSYLMTSESVTKGHPDKICDQIADCILDHCLSLDPDSHVACEVCCTTGTIILMGEISTKAVVDYKAIAREVLSDIGYTNPDYGIDAESCSVIDLIDVQSPEINSAVRNSTEVRGASEGADVEDLDSQGAGDQGIIFGYACDETPELMPLTISMADKLARRLEYVRENDPETFLRPDGKTQVTGNFSDDGTLINIDTILVSTQHEPWVTNEQIYDYIVTNVINPVVEDMGLKLQCDSKITKYIINPSGSFTIGGPHGDTGLTGRKLAVDTYGGHARFGGGAMSGKCPSKVDRSAAYMARYVAKHIVAANLARKCEVQVSYAIGKAKPVSIHINTLGTGNLPDDMLCNYVRNLFDFRPLAIIKNLHLLDTTYYPVSSRCHFGYETSPWEVLDLDKIKHLKEVLDDYYKSYTSIR